MERRELVRWMVASGGLAVLNRLSERDLLSVGEAAHLRATSAFGVLSPAQARIVTAAAERIIPRTSTPGATDANVTAFVDTMLAEWYSPGESASFLRGLDALDVNARNQHTRGFAECSEAEQTALLETQDVAVTERRRSDGAAANAHWFATLKYLTVWGYCTSEPGMRQTLRSWPLAMRYDGNAPV